MAFAAGFLTRRRSTTWDLGLGDLGLLSTASPLHEVSLHFRHTALPAGSFRRASSVGRFRFGEQGANPRYAAFAQVLFDLVARESETGADRRIGIFGVHWLRQTIGRNGPFELVEIRDLAPSKRTEVSRFGQIAAILGGKLCR